MELLLKIEFAITVAVVLDVFPNQAGIRIGNDPFAFQFIKPAIAADSNGLASRVNRQLAADVAGFRRIDADQASPPLAVLRLLATSDVDAAVVINWRREKCVSGAPAAEFVARRFEIDVKFPNQLARWRVE